jgi:hypothetical protein
MNHGFSGLCRHFPTCEFEKPIRVACTQTLHQQQWWTIGYAPAYPASLASIVYIYIIYTSVFLNKKEKTYQMTLMPSRGTATWEAHVTRRWGPSSTRQKLASLDIQYGNTHIHHDVSFLAFSNPIYSMGVRGREHGRLGEGKEEHAVWCTGAVMAWWWSCRLRSKDENGWERSGKPANYFFHIFMR